MKIKAKVLSLPESSGKAVSCGSLYGFFQHVQMITPVPSSTVGT